jgi:two-component system chemotaxis response regulator CheB
MAIEADRSSTEAARRGPGSIRVMVCDDSAVIRGHYTRTLETDPEIRVISSVSDGKMAVASLKRQDVDVIVLDIEMPVMDGLTALPLLLEVSPTVQVIVASTLTRKNAEISMRALRIGAREYVTKPTSTSEVGSVQSFRDELLAKVKALGRSRRAQPGAAQVARRPDQPAPVASEATATPKLLHRGGVVTLRPVVRELPDAIAIGSSTGGPQALFAVVGALRKELSQPIFITQHMPATFTTILAEHLSRVANRPCAEAKDGEPVLPGHIYVAPGDFHMIAEQSGTNRVLRLLKTPPENFCRPSVDPMLRSLAQIYGRRLLVVILTGMGHDGLRGCEVVVKSGGMVIAQDEATSVVWGMPGAVATAGVCSAVLPIDEVGPYIQKTAVRSAA